MLKFLTGCTRIRWYFVAHSQEKRTPLFQRCSYRLSCCIQKIVKHPGKFFFMGFHVQRVPMNDGFIDKILVYGDDEFHGQLGLLGSNEAFFHHILHGDPVAFPHTAGDHHAAHIFADVGQLFGEELVIIGVQDVAEGFAVPTEEHIVENIGVAEGDIVETAVNGAKALQRVHLRGEGGAQRHHVVAQIAHRTEKGQMLQIAEVII